MEQWDKNFYITSVAGASNGNALVVMSKGKCSSEFIFSFKFIFLHFSLLQFSKLQRVACEVASFGISVPSRLFHQESTLDVAELELTFSLQFKGLDKTNGLF